VLLISVPLNTAGLLLIGFMYGFMPPIGSGGARSLFGVKYFPVNLSVVNSMMIFASFSSTIGGAMITSTKSFTGVFIMMLCFALVSAGIFFALKKHL
jgi:OFA family oxalate/formate antiporter-like MFS transporter